MPRVDGDRDSGLPPPMQVAPRARIEQRHAGKTGPRADYRRAPGGQASQPRIGDLLHGEAAEAEVDVAGWCLAPVRSAPRRFGTGHGAGVEPRGPDLTGEVDVVLARSEDAQCSRRLAPHPGQSAQDLREAANTRGMRERREDDRSAVGPPQPPAGRRRHAVAHDIDPALRIPAPEIVGRGGVVHHASTGRREDRPHQRPVRQQVRNRKVGKGGNARIVVRPVVAHLGPVVAPAVSPAQVRPARMVQHLVVQDGEARISHDVSPEVGVGCRVRELIDGQIVGAARLHPDEVVGCADRHASTETRRKVGRIAIVHKDVDVGVWGQRRYDRGAVRRDAGCPGRERREPGETHQAAAPGASNSASMT